MPNTIEELGFTTVALAIALAIVVLVQRRWPNDDPTDPLVLLYRRWAATGRLGFGAKEHEAERAAKQTPTRAAAPAPTGPAQTAPAAKRGAKAAGGAKASGAKASRAKAPRAKTAPATRKKAAKKPSARAPGAKKSPARKPAAPRKAQPRKRQPRPEDTAVEPDVWLDPMPDEEAEDVSPSAPESTEHREPVHDAGAVREAEPVSEHEQPPADDPDAQKGRSRWRRRRRRGEAELPSAPADAPAAPAPEAPAAPPETDIDPTPVAEPPAPAPPEPAAVPPEQEDDRPLLPAEPTRRRRVRADVAPVDDGDHVPLATAQEAQERTGEPKILLRQRFRRGLRRTRERLGSEMREAFTGGATPEAFDRLEEALVAADVGVATTTALVDDLRERIGLSDKTLPDTLKDAMVKQLQHADRRLRLVKGKLSVWVVVGVNGTGKTTTIAKLGARARDLGVLVSLAAADTFRAAAVEQLSEWGRRLGVDVIKQGQGADPGAVVFDAIANAKATGKRLLIVDTAGRLHTRKPLMDELQKVFRVIERDEGSVVAETLLVIDATTGQNGIAQAKAFRDAVSVTGLALAKLDGTAKGGITFAVERELGVPVKAVGVGESEKDLVPFDPQTFVEALVGDD